MIQCGWVREVEALLAAGVPPEAHSLQAIGYRQLVEHLEGRITLEEARRQIIDATRRYAKRQMTWCRRWPQVRWWSVEHEGQIPGMHESVLAAVGRWHGC